MGGAGLGGGFDFLGGSAGVGLSGLGGGPPSFSNGDNWKNKLVILSFRKKIVSLSEIHNLQSWSNCKIKI